MLNNKNLEIARQFVWTMSRLKVNYFPTQASLYRAIETIKFPHLNRIKNLDVHPIPDWMLATSPANRTKNVYSPINYQGIVDFLMETGFIFAHTWITNGKVIRRSYTADFKIPGIRSEIGETRYSTEFWQVTPEIAKEYESWSKLDMSARFPVMSDIDDCINAHKAARAERRQAKRKPVVETKFVEGDYKHNFASDVLVDGPLPSVQVPQSVLSLTREELQELYYLVGIGKKHAQLMNESIANRLIDKISDVIISK